MTCCNQNCNQGRDCPEPLTRGESVTFWLLALTPVALAALVLLALPW